MKDRTLCPLVPVGFFRLPHRLSWAARLRLWLFILVNVGFCATSEAGLKIYYLRHAEAGHNVVDAWKHKPKEQWPAYVGNPDMFSPKGQEQVAASAKKLKKYHFDFVAVSPMWRTRNTIAPYLKEEGLKAEIWPELLEFGSLSKQHDFAQLPAPSADLFSGGERMKLSGADQELFSLRKDGGRKFKLGEGAAQVAADRWAVVQKDVELIRTRFGGSEKAILLVGHGNSGRLLLEALTKDRELFKVPLANTGLWMVEEQANGSFKLQMLNDEPVSLMEAKGRNKAAPKAN